MTEYKPVERKDTYYNCSSKSSGVRDNQIYNSYYYTVESFFKGLLFKLSSIQKPKTSFTQLNAFTILPKKYKIEDKTSNHY